MKHQIGKIMFILYVIFNLLTRYLRISPQLSLEQQIFINLMNET